MTKGRKAKHLKRATEGKQDTSKYAAVSSDSEAHRRQGSLSPRGNSALSDIASEKENLESSLSDPLSEKNEPSEALGVSTSTEYTGTMTQSSIVGKERDVHKVVDELIEDLKKFSLAIPAPELSDTQIETNYQEQQDEVFALKAIYGDDVSVDENKDGIPHMLKISIHVEILKNISIKVKFPSITRGHTHSGGNSKSFLNEEISAGNVYTFHVQHLPPLTLLCVLPKAYPCSVPPHFAVFSQWLDSSSISKLCNCLDKIWDEEPGQVVIFKWADWLHTSVLSYLGFENEVLIDLHNHNLRDNTNVRAVPGFSSPDVDIPRLIQYNEEKNNQLFRSSMHVCPICFSEFAGINLIKLQCQHFYCWHCMETYSLLHVKDGTVTKLKCPDSKCDCAIPPALLNKLLGDDAFQRWESLLLQKTLDSMSDVVYCPRCESVCLEEEDHHAQCAKCFYSFCSLCRDRRHVGQTCLTPEIRLHILQERQNSRQNSDHTNAEKRRQEQNLINELLSMKEILRDSKQCPTCKIAISKTEGCNKMTCYNCGQYFCYKCNKPVDGYDHFGSASCILFEPEEIRKWERTMNDRQLQDIARAELWPHLGHPCPSCGQLNVKQGNNNHMCCWSCQSHYCALCHKIVRRSSEHYGPRGCRQHTAD